MTWPGRLWSRLWAWLHGPQPAKPDTYRVGDAGPEKTVPPDDLGPLL